MRIQGTRASGSPLPDRISREPMLLIMENRISYYKDTTHDCSCKADSSRFFHFWQTFMRHPSNGRPCGERRT
jgi:hypothetical protein